MELCLYMTGTQRLFIPQTKFKTNWWAP